jgi:hypothetical protein
MIIVALLLSFFGRNFGKPVVVSAESNAAMVSAETADVLAKGIVIVRENGWCDLELGLQCRTVILRCGGIGM